MKSRVIMKKILKPEVVPWMLALAGSDVQIHVDEELGCTITFCARFALEETLRTDGEPGVFRTVRLRFPDFPRIKIYRPSESSGVDFDYALAFEYDPNCDRDEEHARFMRIWSITKCCPLPGIYEIVNSELIPEHSKVKHLIIQGNEVWVELETLSYTWTAEDYPPS